MHLEMAKEIIACLPKERTLYRYFKDGYAVQLLQRYLQRHGDQSVAQVKRSRFGRLLNKPALAPALAQSGGGLLRADVLHALWVQPVENYVLTLGLWGSPKDYDWAQVSRPGANLVLQLNFDSRHDRLCRANLDGNVDLFHFGGHPVSRRRCTLAWARIDLDFDTDEALIEEIQTDWLRCARWLKARLRWLSDRGRREFRYRGEYLCIEKVTAYLNDVMQHEALWSEAMLNAAINFVADEVGVRHIYYHSFNTGLVLKRIRYGSHPPASLYTKLPKQFCFNTVADAPALIQNNNRARRRLKAAKQPRWFYMAV